MIWQMDNPAHACMWATGIRKLRKNQKTIENWKQALFYIPGGTIKFLSVRQDSACFYKNAGWAISEILQFPDVNADKIWYDIWYEISNRRNCGKTKQLPGQDNETAGDRNEREN